MQFSKRAYCLLLAVLCLHLLLGMASANGQNVRYRDSVFSSFNLTSNIRYGSAPLQNGVTKDLLLDFYSPAGDTAVNRPLLIFFHGGGFRNNDKVGKFSSMLCSAFTKHGYAAASVNYRLAAGALHDSTEYFTALYLAQQDARSAVRFFKHNAAKYAVDSSRIIVAGTSAGAKLALHLAYMGNSDIPQCIDTAALGGLEGNSGNSGAPSGVFAVLNFWGALWNLDWLNEGGTPLFCVHGVNDTLVPYDSAFSYHGFRYGSVPLYQRAQSLGIYSGLRLFYNTGHTLDNNAAKQDSAISSALHWLYPLLTGVGSTTGCNSKLNMLHAPVCCTLPLRNKRSGK